MSLDVLIVVTISGLLLIWGAGFEIKIDMLEKALRRGNWTTPKHLRLARRRAALWFIPSRIYFAREIAMERAKRAPEKLKHGE